ncbi:hypothetical protein GCM10027059_18240 [Myceligenerans halotolerans]
MASETMGTKPGAIRDGLGWPARGGAGWGRAGHLGWRVFAVLVLVIALVYPWGPVATADDAEPPSGPTAQEATEARDAVRAGELDVAQAEAALAGLRQDLEDAQIGVQMAAADHEDAVAALDAAEAEVREAREEADRAGNAEAKARAALAAVYRAAQRSGGADALGPLEVVLEAEDIDDLIGQEAAERAVRRKLAAALTEHSRARAASEAADARWSAAREERADAKAEAEAAYDAAQRAVAELAARTEAAERDRALLIERLAELRNTSIRIEREREDARAAAARAEREAEARAALGAGQQEAGAGMGDVPASGGDGAGSGDGDTGDKPADTSAPADDPGSGLAPAPEPPPAPEPAPEPVPEPPAPDPSGSWSSASAQGQAAVAWARTKIGSPYLLGAEGPASYDCSGLTSEAWRYAGHWITRTSRSQYLAVSHIGYGELRPGDLIFYGSDLSDPQSIYHVAMYTGNGRMIEAVMPGVSLRETDLRLSGAMPYAGRP